MMQPMEAASPSPESIAASCVAASAMESVRPPESIPKIMPAATEGSDPIAVNRGLNAGATARPTAGAAHMMPTRHIASGPIAASPRSNSSPYPKRLLKSALSAAPITMKIAMRATTIPLIISDL